MLVGFGTWGEVERKEASGRSGSCTWPESLGCPRKLWLLPSKKDSGDVYTSPVTFSPPMSIRSSMSRNPWGWDRAATLDALSKKRPTPTLFQICLKPLTLVPHVFSERNPVAWTNNPHILIQA